MAPEEKCISYIARYSTTDTIDGFSDSTSTARTNIKQQKANKHNDRQVHQLIETVFDQLIIFILMMLSFLYFIISLVIQLGNKVFLAIQHQTDKVQKLNFLCASTAAKDWRIQAKNLLTSPKPWQTKTRKLLRSIKTASLKATQTISWPSTGNFKFIPSTTETFKYRLPKHLGKGGGQMNHIHQNTTPVYPIQILENLPCIVGKVGNRKIPFLLDSGCFYSLIPKDIVTEFEQEFYKLTRFTHNTSLIAHNNSAVPVQEDGVIIPVRLTDINGQSKVIDLQFIVEIGKHLQPIIGYRDIKSIGICPTQDVTFTDLKTKMKDDYTTHSIVHHTATSKAHTADLRGLTPISKAHVTHFLGPTPTSDVHTADLTGLTPTSTTGHTPSNPADTVSRVQRESRKISTKNNYKMLKRKYYKPMQNLQMLHAVHA